MRKLLIVLTFWGTSIFILAAQNNSTDFSIWKDSIQQLADRGWYL